jgi:hypothetical protein
MQRKRLKAITGESIVFINLLFVIVALIQAQVPIEIRKDWNKDMDVRMEWWHTARYGMFIHWGAYALTTIPRKMYKATNAGDSVIVELTVPAPDFVCSIIVLDVEGKISLTK